MEVEEVEGTSQIAIEMFNNVGGTPTGRLFTNS